MVMEATGGGERDLGREPCPDRIIEDLGGAFGMGCVGGFLWHFVKGARNSPKGEIVSGGLYSARMRAPILGGNFAVWGGTFSCFDCSLQYLRKKEDHWNAIASGFCTGGVLAMRGGWRSASRNAVIGGVLLAIIEGVSVVLSRKTTPTPRQQFQQQMEYEKTMKELDRKTVGANSDGSSESSTGWLDRLTLRKTPEDAPSTSGQLLSTTEHSLKGTPSSSSSSSSSSSWFDSPSSFGAASAANELLADSAATHLSDSSSPAGSFTSAYGAGTPSAASSFSLFGR